MPLPARSSSSRKSGTNTLHGEGGELFKSTSMMHRRFFQRTTLQQDNPDNHTLFQMPDFFVSGPVYIPKLYNGKNRTFFQVGGSYHIDSSSNASSYATPTPEMLAGNFSAYSNVIYDPNSTIGKFRRRQPEPHSLPGQHHSHEPLQHACGKRSPPTTRSCRPRRAPAASPTSAPAGNIVTSGTGNYFNLTNQFRVDHNFNSKMRMSLSYSTGNQHQPQNNVNIVYTPYDQYQTLQYTIQNHAALSVHLHDQPDPHQRDQGWHVPPHRQLPAPQPAKIIPTPSPKPFPTCLPTCT